MKIYDVYVDDSSYNEEHCFKVVIPAFSEAEAGNSVYVEGNGEVVSIKEDKSFNPISVSLLSDILCDSGKLNRRQTDIIIRALVQIGIAD